MKEPVEITRAEATEIMRANMTGPVQTVVMCYCGKWWSLIGITPEEREVFIKKLLGPKYISEEKRTTINVTL